MVNLLKDLSSKPFTVRISAKNNSNDSKFVLTMSCIIIVCSLLFGFIVSFMFLDMFYFITNKKQSVLDPWV